ncbi:hypothetical protein PCASD_25358 [Puccinia coronata f. sp. avenae]|uniref:Uncharacterized protein n=1 Tax=Puccinia coronata f. sp. avenae TaxID=200324 RepID=A0A2N5RUY7_9BASI|nr:hypothetical protein PCASD_25358 [Puccinia coronata f. sp. avenae]
MAASELIADTAIRFKLGRRATTIHSVARRPSMNRMAASDVNSDAAIRASFAGQEILSTDDLRCLNNGREDATERLKNSFELLPVHEIGQRITGERSDIAQYVYKKERGQSILTSVSEEAIHATSVQPLYSSMSIVGKLAIDQESKEKLKKLITSMQNHMTHLISISFSNKNDASESKTVAATRYNVDFAHEERIQYEDLDLVNNLKAAWDLLKTSVSSRQLSERKVVEIYSMMFVLSDVVLDFLIASAESHNLLISEETLKKMFNQEIGAQMILNHLWGKFPLKSSFTEAYLNFDFQESLEHSPFTQHLAVVLKYLNKDKIEGDRKADGGFQRLARSYLALQIKSFAVRNGFSDRELERIDHKFLQVTSPEAMKNSNQVTFDANIRFFLEDLMTLTLSPQAISNHHAVQVKLYHNMLRFIIKYHINGVSTRNQSKIKGLDIYPQVEAFDAIIMSLSESINSLYAKYGEVVQELAFTMDHTSEQYAKKMIFLTDTRTKAYYTLLGKDSESNVTPRESRPKHLLEDTKPNDRVRSLIVSWRAQTDTTIEFEKIIYPKLASRTISKPAALDSLFKWTKVSPFVNRGQLELSRPLSDYTYRFLQNSKEHIQRLFTEINRLEMTISGVKYHK